MKRIAYLFVPYLLALATANKTPGLRQQAIAIYREGRIVGVCPRLKDQSLVGMPLAQARGRCPGVSFAEYDRSIHQAAHEDYLRMLSALSPLIEPLHEQECFFDLSGSNIQGDLKRLGKWFEEREWGPVILGLGANKLLARLAARVPSPKLTGKFQNLYVFEVNPGREQEFMARVPIALDWLLPPRAVEALALLGFTRFGELDSFLWNDLYKLLGREAYLIQHHRQGLDNTPLMGLYPPEMIRCYQGFDQGTEDWEVLRRSLGEGARTIALALQAKRIDCRLVALELELEQGVCRAERQAARGCGEESRLNEVLRLLLSELAWQGPVQGLTIQVSSLFEPKLVEQDLFAPDRQSSRPRQSLNPVLEALQAKLPGMIRTGFALDRREEVLSLWDPWRFREGRV